jgi:predicted dehydrogenase
MKAHWNRREVLRQAALLGAAAAVGLPRTATARPRSPGEKLNIACIGVGGRGWANTQAMAKENVVALCDVDSDRLEAAAKHFPNAHKYVDFRELFARERDLDATVVSTPDHTHAAASLLAMEQKLHVYCEKPLTHSVFEARQVAGVAARTNVITQMGTGGQSSEGFWRTVAALQSGVIGDVVEVHHWTNRPIWPQGQDRPAGTEDPPATLNWGLWTGPAPMRPYLDKYKDGPHKGAHVYHPFVWRGWADFGTGALGDIAPHSMNVTFRALKLGAPKSIDAQCSGFKGDAFPSWSIIRFDFPASGGRGPVRLTWYDGGKKPPAALVEEKQLPDNGVIFVGRKGVLYGGTLLPKKQFTGYEWPKPAQEPYAEVHEDWLDGIRTGRRPGCDFAYAGPMTEAYLLGNISLLVGRRIEWDPVAFRVTNCEQANRYLKREYRKGWETG